MYFVKGLIIGLILSMLAITSMILVARFILIKGWKHGCSAALGAYLSQSILATAAVAALVLLHSEALITTHSSIEAVVSMYITAGLLLILAYDLYKEPMPKPEKLAQINITHPFTVVFSKSMRKLTRLVGYLALIAVFIANTSHLTITKGGELLIGILIPMALWWTGFIILVNKLHGKISPKGLHHLNKVGAAILLLLALWILFSLLF